MFHPLRFALFVILVLCSFNSFAVRSAEAGLCPQTNEAAHQQEYELGFSGEEVAGAGIRIRSVNPGGPLTRLQISSSPGSMFTANPGDVIVALNGVAIRSMADLRIQLSTLGSTNGQCALTMRNVYSGTNVEWTVKATATDSSTGPDPPNQPPATSNPATYSLQISGRALLGQGIQISGVTAGGPAASMSDPLNLGAALTLDPGDLVLAINGVNVQSVAAYQNVMSGLSASSGRARIRFRDVRTGQIREWDTTAVTIGGGDGGGENDDADNAAGQQPRKVHILICGQSGTNDDSFNRSISKGLSNIDRLLMRVGDDFVGSKTILRDDECTAEKIMNAIAELRPNPEDSIFFYYTGHGAHDDNGHYFNLRGTGGFDLPRRNVAAALKNHDVRLAVMISESCNAASVEAVLGESRAETVQSNTLTEFEDLLLGYRGWIDLNSADTGQYGWADANEGGYFTKFFSAELMDLNPGANWPDSIAEIGRKTNEFYQTKRQGFVDRGNVQWRMRDQESLTPQIHALAVQRDACTVDPGIREFYTQTTVFIPGQQP